MSWLRRSPLRSATAQFYAGGPSVVDDQGERRRGDVVRHIRDDEKIGITKGIVERLFLAIDRNKQLIDSCTSKILLQALSFYKYVNLFQRMQRSGSRKQAVRLRV